MKHTRSQDKDNQPIVHTVEEAESQQEGVACECLEDEIQSEDDATSIGTDAGELGATLLQLSLHCGARYVHKKSQQDYVCYGKPKCRREGHAGATKGLEGAHQVEKDGKALGAPVATYMSEETYRAVLERTRINNRAAMAAVARGDSKTAAALFNLASGEESGAEKNEDPSERPDSFKGKLEKARARMAEAEDFLTGTKAASSKTTPKEPAVQEAARRSPFNSPLPNQIPVDHFAGLAPSSTNSTLNTSQGTSPGGSLPGKGLKTNFLNSNNSSKPASLSQEIAPLVSLFSNQINDMQEGMIKLQEKLSSLEATDSKAAKSRRRKKGKRKKKKCYSSSSSSGDTSSSESGRGAPELANHRTVGKSHHAVANGRGGISNVFPTAEEALPLVVGHSGAQCQAFHDCNEAWRWLFDQDQRMKRASDKNVGRIEQAPPSMWCQPTSSQLPGDGSLGVINTPVPEASLPTSPPILPTVVLGSDPSLKKKDEAFGAQLNKDVGSIRKAFSPPGVNTQTMKDLCGSMLDVVSLPGKNVSVANEEVAQLSEAFGEVLQQRAEAMNQDIRRDLNWKNESRISLKRITNSTELREMVADVNADGEDEMNKVMNNVTTILSRYPWPTHVLEAWKTHGYITRMSRDGVDCYCSLLQRLQFVDANSGWKEAKEEMQFHLKKLTRIRASASNREECMFKTYAYLRDSRAADWSSPKLDRAKIEAVQKELQQVKAQAPNWVCPKCKTSLIHSQGSPCPFKDKSNSDAKKLGEAILKALGDS